MRITAKNVQCMELFTEAGKSLGLFRLDSTWNGFRDFQNLKTGDKIITDGPDHWSVAMGDILGVTTEMNQDVIHDVPI